MFRVREGGRGGGMADFLAFVCRREIFHQDLIA